MTETIESILAKRGWPINTSLIERLNLEFRQHVAAIGRRVNTLCKHEAGLRHQLALFQTYHNFCLPHASLRLPLPELDTLSETGSIKRWQPLDAGDDGGPDRPCVEPEGGADVPRAPVAAESDGLRASHSGEGSKAARKVRLNYHAASTEAAKIRLKIG